jgi:hypothetical protein
MVDISKNIKQTFLKKESLNLKIILISQVASLLSFVSTRHRCIKHICKRQCQTQPTITTVSRQQNQEDQNAMHAKSQSFKESFDMAPQTLKWIMIASDIATLPASQQR